MKKKLLFCLGCVALLFAGCTTDINEVNGPVNYGAPQIKISGSINQQYISRVNDGGFCNGDQIGLYGVNYTAENTVPGALTDEGNQVNNARYTYDEQNGIWTSEGAIYYKDAETNIDLYAYYPYANINSVSAYTFEVAQDQSGETIVDGFAQSDFIWGKVENVTPSGDKVHIHFNHKLSSVSVMLTEGQGFEEGEFDALKKGVLVMNTTRKAEIDLSTGVAIAAGEVEREGIVMKHNAEGFRAIVVPQSIEGGTALFAITIDGITYRFKMEEKCLYEAGKQCKFTIKINKKNHTGDYELVLTDTEIVEWIADADTHDGEGRQYYVVHLDEPNTLEAKIRAEGKNPAKIKNLKVSGQIGRDDFYFMRDKMDILKAINLKESKIVDWKRYWWGYIDGEYKKLYFYTEYPETWEDMQREVEARYPEHNLDHRGHERNNDNRDDVIPGYAFNGKFSLVHFVFPEVVKKIEGWAFVGTTLSGALIIPDDVVEIEGGAFSGTNISSLSLPANLKKLGESVFSYCRSLAGSLVLPESLEEIGGNCFSECSMLSGTLTLPSKLTAIPGSCFYGCGFTGDLVIPENVKEIGSYAFAECNKFNGHLTLSNQIKKIDDGAFIRNGFQGELVIPKSVQIIAGGAFEENNFSSIIFEEGSELIKIEALAFYGNWRISEPINLPEGLMTIGAEAFQCCGNIPAITIPSTITTIGEEAFRDCYYITKLRCDAAMPPVVGSGAFNGVGKENLTLQVPEASVALYQTADGWCDFNRISAYHDFSISRKHIRALNAEYSKSYLLRAPSGEPWSVESCPEWVTVTPSSGVGRCDVTVTISSMEADEVGSFTFEEMDTWGNWKTETHAGRAGDIVFLLNNKEYRVTMAAQQYDYEYGDGDVIVNQTATAVDSANGVNLVFMGDCFDARDIAMGSYLNGINEAIGYFFAIEPYKTYRDYFNVYTVFGMSADSGVGTVNTVKDAKFGSQYSLAGIAPDTQITYEYAMKSPTVEYNNINKSLVVMVENTTDYGGICYMWGDGSAIAICPMSRDAYPFDYRGIVQHEAGGHGFAKLADEYIYHNAFISACGCPCCSHLTEFYGGKSLGWYRNLSDNGDHNTVEWAHLFDHPDYMNIVDMYEGGYFHTRGIYRSEANSCMNNNVPYYSAISRQEMVERIMRYSGNEFDINDFYARDVRDASNNDFVTSATLSAAEPTLENMASAAKQMAPKYMGSSPFTK